MHTEEATPSANTGASKYLNQEWHWGKPDGLLGERLTLAITDLRTRPKEGQENRQQNESVENPQDGEDRQDSKEVSGRQKGRGTRQRCKESIPPSKHPSFILQPRAQLNNPTPLKQVSHGTVVQTFNTRLARGFVLFFNLMTPRTTFHTLEC